jgi:hypothetical protein
MCVRLSLISYLTGPPIPVRRNCGDQIPVLPVSFANNTSKVTGVACDE